MIIAIISYFVVSFFIVVKNSNKKIKYSTFPVLKMTMEGIVFCSYKTHRIYISNSKYMQIEKRVYIKNGNRMLVIENVDQVTIKNSYLYFKSLGETKILINCKNIYRYFNLEVSSPNFEFKKIKSKTILSLVNNPFEENVEVKRYINFLKNILNIRLTGDKICIKSNKYKIPIKVIYKLNGKVKCVSIC